MQKITVPEKYNEKNLNNFILDKFPNLNINMLYKALRQKDIKKTLFLSERSWKVLNESF